MRCYSKAYVNIPHPSLSLRSNDTFPKGKAKKNPGAHPRGYFLQIFAKVFAENCHPERQRLDTETESMNETSPTRSLLRLRFFQGYGEASTFRGGGRQSLTEGSPLHESKLEKAPTWRSLRRWYSLRIICLPLGMTDYSVQRKKHPRDRNHGGEY